MSGLEVAIGQWRIRLPQAWTYLDGQTFTFFKSRPELGQFQISTARQVSGPGADLGASGLRTMLLKMAKVSGYPPPRKIQESQTRQIVVVWGNLDSNGTYLGRMWFASHGGGCLLATYFSPVGKNPDIDEEIVEAHEALLGVHVVTQ
jgi:hypothetical protein